MIDYINIISESHIAAKISHRPFVHIVQTSYGFLISGKGSSTTNAIAECLSMWPNISEIVSFPDPNPHVAKGEGLVTFEHVSWLRAPLVTASAPMNLHHHIETYTRSKVQSLLDLDIKYTITLKAM